MTWKSALLAALSLFTALLLQRSALPLFALPGAAPLPMLVIVVAFALVKGPFDGCGPGVLRRVVRRLGATDHPRRRP